MVSAYKSISLIKDDDDFKDYNIYYFDEKKNIYRLLKKPGLSLNSVCSEEQRAFLYYFVPEKIKLIEDKNSILNKELKDGIKKENIVKVKECIVKIVDNHFSEPRHGSLKGIDLTVNLLIDEYFGQYAILANFAKMQNKDYTTAVHSINVMALTLAFSFYLKLSKVKVYNYGLSALLHDIGKVEIPDSILKSERKLSSDEYNLVKKHPIIGVDILKDYTFPKDVIDGCIHHHERLDGSGYPTGLKGDAITEIGKILAIIDPFEAITSSERIYKRKVTSEKALEMIFVEEGDKIDRKIFYDFVKALGIVEKIF